MIHESLKKIFTDVWYLGYAFNYGGGGFRGYRGYCCTLELFSPDGSNMTQDDQHQRSLGSPDAEKNG